MPTYEYQCPDGHTFDVFQKMSDAAEASCPVCGLPAIRRISGGAGLVFKGSGFYITDYGKDGKGPRKAPAEGGEKGDKADRGDKGNKGDKPASDSKPAAESKPAKSDKPASPAPAPKGKKGGE